MTGVSKSRHPVLPWIWTGLVLAATIAVVLADDPSASQGPLFLVLPTLYTAMGALIATRQPGNRISWLFFLAGAHVVVEPAALLRIDHLPDPPEMLDLLAIIYLKTGFWFALVVPLCLLLFLFPTGGFLTRRWAWAGWLAGIMVADALFAETFAAEFVGQTPRGDTLSIANPIGFLDFSGFTDADAGVLGVFRLVFGLGLFTLMFAGIAATVVRYLRSSSTVRAQIKWVAYAMAVWVLILTSKLLMNQEGLAADLVADLSLGLIPASITVAITRYRLFEIDRLISRTVGYALVVATLGLVYAAGAVWLPAQLTGEQSPVFVAGSTLAVAVLFNPIRHRIMQWVDLRFYRSRYDSERVVEEFGRGLKDEVDVDRLTDDVTAVVIETMRPSSAGSWVRGSQDRSPGEARRRPRNQP